MRTRNQQLKQDLQVPHAQPLQEEHEIGRGGGQQHARPQRHRAAGEQQQRDGSADDLGHGAWEAGRLSTRPRQGAEEPAGHLLLARVAQHQQHRVRSCRPPSRPSSSAHRLLDASFSLPLPPPGSRSQLYFLHTMNTQKPQNPSHLLDVAADDGQLSHEPQHVPHAARVLLPAVPARMGGGGGRAGWSAAGEREWRAAAASAACFHLAWPACHAWQRQRSAPQAELLPPQDSAVRRTHCARCLPVATPSRAARLCSRPPIAVDHSSTQSSW